MIKCSWFGKLLKQSFFISLISFFGLSVGCFASAFNYGGDLVQTVGLQDSQSILDNQYDITFLKGGAFKSMFLGQAKSLFALNNNNFMFWNDGKLYIYGNYTRYGYGSVSLNGYYLKYNSCDEITGFNFDIGNAHCSEQIIGSDYRVVFKNFFQSVNAGDYVYYYYDAFIGTVGGYFDWNICFSNSTLHKSICFISNQGLTGNLNLPSDTTFSTISQNLLGYAPGQAGYDGGGNIDGGSVEVNQSPLTGNTMYANCTKGLAFQWYRANGYKSRMCYSSRSNTNEIFSGSSVNYVENFVLTGVDFDELYLDTANLYRFGNTGDIMSEINWLDYWRKTYEVYKRNQGSVNNPFNGVPVALFTFMGNVDSYGLPYNSASVLEFCNLSLYTSNYSAPYTGIASSRVCTMSAIDILDMQIANENNPDDGLPGDGNTDGTVGYIGSSWVGVTDRAGKYNKPGSTGSDLQLTNTGYQNGKSFMNNFFNSITENFKFPEGEYPGVLPSYIIITLCGIIIFRFLSH